MQCYTELVPPSGVTSALSLPFTSSEASNLIVARTSLLQIFSHRQANHGQDTKLVWVADYSLSGTITSLGRVKILSSKGGGEAILIAFRDAKLSLVEWDPEKYSISTISIHYYESEALQRSPWVPTLSECVNYLTVDPSSRCAVFHFGMTNIAIIPFHQVGDDLVMDDYEAEFDREDAERSPTKKTNGDTGIHQTPYASSFVLPLTALDPGILHPVHLAFLHEYREPTFGIIYSTVARSSALHYERTDVTHYAVFTLDLEQRASTTLLSIPKLPNDLFAVIPLPLPVGGALLVGTNELIHVDQGGKTNAIGVNEFARQLSSFSMADHSENRMHLEGCQIEQLNASTGDMLVVLATGDLAMLTFRLDGRSVSGMTISQLPHEHAHTLFRARASCITPLGTNRLFVGSDVADSVLLGTARKTTQLKKHGSKIGQQRLDEGRTHKMNADEDDSGEEEDDDDDDDDEDDLYSDALDKTMTGQSDGVATSGSSLRVLDRLHCVAPLRDVALGRVAKRKREDEEDEGSRIRGQIVADTDLVATSGEGLAGGVTILSRELRHQVVGRSKIMGSNGIWSFPVRSSAAASDHLRMGKSYDEFMIVSRMRDAQQAESVLHECSHQLPQVKMGSDFDPAAGGTIECGLIANGAHIVQVVETQVRVYDRNFGLSQIWLIVDEEIDVTAKAISASFADPFVLVLRDDNSILLLKTDKKGELDEVNLEGDLANEKYSSACLYSDRHGTFASSQNLRTSNFDEEAPCILALLSADGALSIYSLSDLQTKLFHYDGAQFLPVVITHNTPLPRHWKGVEPLSELLIAEIGDSDDTRPYLIFRSSGEDVAIYKPFRVLPTIVTDDNGSDLGFRKIPLRQMARSNPEDIADHSVDRSRPMKVASVNGHSVVLVPGASPAMIAKAATSSPRVYLLSTGPVLAFSGHHTATCPQGFAYLDRHGNLSMATCPPGILIGHSDWVQRKVEVGADVSGITYLERTQSYILGTSQKKDFQLPQDDEWHAEWKNEAVTCLPQLEQGSVKLLSSKTFNIIDTFQLEYAERAMCIKSMNLEVSEESHERKDLVVVGTAITKGEDVVARGSIYIFDVVDVVPQPGVPETDLKLKLIAKEEVKGAVTSLCQVGSQGFMLAAQGQKCMVRGLKEDLSILPVAFMDMKYYVNIVKELEGTGLCILGDAMNGLWFVGYSEEPYKMQLFGRDQLGLEVMAAEFLPDEKNLFLIAADGDGDLHVLQFDPESPESERGTRLLHRSTFFSGSFVSTMTLLPQKINSSLQVGGQGSRQGSFDESPQGSQRQILVTCQEGSMGLFTSLPEQTYRRLSALQNILTTSLEHPCGLNPRAYRAVETDGIGGAAVLDGTLVQRWLDQDSFQQSSTADKVGSTVWEVREDLRAIRGCTLQYI